MHIAKTISDLKQMRMNLSGSVGFVPTMGYLHDGHLSLVKQSKDINSATIVSIFINPTQFSPTEDFNSYPRDISQDKKKLEQVKADILFIPSAEEMYPQGFNTRIEIVGLTEQIEGKSRPGHFTGVATVVLKLFNIVQPTRAYFGQKDAQQVLVIKKMASDLNTNIEIVTCPTIRESDGLAMSSRNIYLEPGERKAATVLYKSLTSAKKQWGKGERRASVLRDNMISMINREPLAALDYVSIADSTTLKELSLLDRPALISIAVKIGNTRLIDNIVI